MRRCPNCGFYNFDISTSCGRCEAILAAATKNSLPKSGTIKAVSNVSAAQNAVSQSSAANIQHPTIMQKLSRLELEISSLPPLPPSEHGDICQEITIPVQDEPTADILTEEGASALMESIANMPVDDSKQTGYEVTLPSFFRRYSATIIDGLLAFTVFAVILITTLSVPVVFTTQETPFYGLDRFIDLMTAHYETFISALLITAVAFVLYHAFLIATWGKTFGQALLGIKVASTKNGQKPGFFRSTWRAFFEVIGVLFLGIGLYWRILDPFHRGWGDLAASTIVVKK